MTWNPITAYFRWKAAERAADRAVISEAIGMLKASFDAQRAQSDAFKVFLEGFKVTEPPVERHWDETADNVKWLKEHGKVPDDLKPTDVPREFSALINNFDKFHIADLD